jgi:hypothetical protein
VIAFANLLCTEVHREASVDLMRYRPDAPPGTMDFLFARILLHLQAEGYERFGLGMAPMAGMAERRRAPRWQRIGRLLFEYGERFYNFAASTASRTSSSRVGAALPGGGRRGGAAVRGDRRGRADRRRRQGRDLEVGQDDAARVRGAAHRAAPPARR